MIPQIIYIGLSLFGLGIFAAKHGQYRDPYNFWSALIAEIIIFPLLYWGGFFDVFFK